MADQEGSGVAAKLACDGQVSFIVASAAIRRSNMVAVAKSPLSIGPAALAMQVTEYQLRRAIARGVITPPRFGRYTMFPVESLPAWRKAMENAGIVSPAASTSPPLAAV